MSLPCAHGLAAPPVESTPERFGNHRANVLIVDDKPMLGTAIQRILSQEHDVTVATSAMQAIQLIQDGKRFDVILFDLMMPEMTGMDLHAEMLKLAPEQARKMISMTGGAFSAEAAAFLHSIPNPSIEKLFKTAALWQVVQDKLK